MIDYIKLSSYSAPFANKLRENDLLRVWETRSNSRSGVRYEKAKYKGLLFILYQSGRIEISGSVHMYMNNGKHNFNDFSMNDFDAVLQELITSFGPEILLMSVQNLEFGLNIKPEFTASEFTEKVVVYLSRGARLKHAITKDDAKGFDKGIKFILLNYILKLYDKSSQYRQKGNILRCEYKTCKMASVKEANIETIADLLKPSVTSYLFDKLITSIDNLVINESIDIKELTPQQDRIVLECVNPDFWTEISKFKRKDRKKQFEALTYNFGTTDIKAIVKQLLTAKYQDLILKDNQTHYLFTNPANKAKRLSGQTKNEYPLPIHYSI